MKMGVMSMTIADRIRNRRLELGLSVDDLAKLLNKDRSTVYRYESNYIKTYQPDVMESLAKVLQTTPSYFYGYDDSIEDQEMPVTSEARILARGIDKLPESERKKALAVVQAMFAQYADYFEKGDEHDTRPE